MTDLGLAFDDDDLDTYKKEKKSDTDLPYGVKIVNPRWFDGAHENHQWGDQAPQVLKYRGDYSYRLADYATAAHHYKAALDILPENNVAVSQDLRESLSRCQVFLGEYDEALTLARNLVMEMRKEDEAHQRQSVILLAFVCEKASLWQECIESLERLCLLQPSFPQTWCQLGDVIPRLAQPLPGWASQEAQSSDPNQEHSIDYIKQNHEEGKARIPLIIRLTCYARARLLFESVLENASNFIKARNQELIIEVSNKINSISLPEQMKKRAFETARWNLDVSTKEDSKGQKDNEVEPTRQHTDIFTRKDISELFFQQFCSWCLKL